MTVQLQWEQESTAVESDFLIEVRDLVKHFPVRQGFSLASLPSLLRFLFGAAGLLGSLIVNSESISTSGIIGFLNGLGNIIIVTLLFTAVGWLLGKVIVRGVGRLRPAGAQVAPSGHVVKAVDGVSFTIRRGEALGLVGESGCGKTTVGRLLLNLIEPTSGQILFEGRDIAGLSEHELKPFRRQMQIIFQDPFSSLDPRTPIGDSIGEGLRVHGISDGRQRQEQVLEIMRKVGLEDYHARRYPHEFSGGQRQRIGIARALILRPKFIVCDEPVSALDVSIQAQVLNLLRQLQQEFGLTYLFIAHNMSVVEHISDRVAVMYLGKIVEVADRDEMYRNPQHPYTQALMSAIPIPDPNLKRERTLLKGDVPSPLNPPSGCRFHPRCPVAIAICSKVEPPLLDLGGGHLAACHLRQPANHELLKPSASRESVVK